MPFQRRRREAGLALRPGNSVFKEPYLTLIGAIATANKQRTSPASPALMCENFAQAIPKATHHAPDAAPPFASPLIALCMEESITV
jgi:hypothetical protein